MITQIGRLQIADDVSVTISGTVAAFRDDDEFLLRDDTGQVWVDGTAASIALADLTIGAPLTVVGEFDDAEDFDAVALVPTSPPAVIPMPSAATPPTPVPSGETSPTSAALIGSLPPFSTIGSLPIRDDVLVTIGGTIVGFRDDDEFRLADSTGQIWVDSLNATPPTRPLALGDGVIVVGDRDDAEDFDALRIIEFSANEYLASYPDLLNAFGADQTAAIAHFVTHGITEGRSPDRFDAQAYLDNYDDLRAAFSNDLAAATQHYVQFGYDELRDPINGGFFNAGAYIASYDDLIGAFGTDYAVGELHYRQHGRPEGRAITFHAGEYLASYNDLIEGLGYDLDAAVDHFITFGSQEGRVRDQFDAEGYLNAFPDLQAAFGNALDAAIQHYVQFGYAEGRDW